MALTRVVSGGGLLGSTFLNIEHPKAPDDLWVLLPAIATPRRLVSSNLADSYLGSEFRYGDLVQNDPDEYIVTSRGDATIDDEPCWIIEAVPREPKLVRDTGLSKQVLWLRKSTLVERRVEQYDRRGALLKIMEITRVFTDPQGSHYFGSERNIRNAQSGVTSAVVFENILVNRGMPADLFTTAHLGELPK
jgi:outer membrane lipoprotein-sorting protein